MYQGPFRNIDPQVRYVGDRACAECHTDEDHSYHHHPMGRSVVPIAQLASQQPYDEAHHNPFTALGSQFRVRREGDRLVHQQILVDDQGRRIDGLDMEVAYALGSGTHGYGYLTIRGDSLLETPISWYSQKARWDLSPGFIPEWFGGRPVGAGCLYCHANQTHPLEGLLNRYEKPIVLEAIGCERCHGPGERHVASRRRLDPLPGPVDDTIVNPRHLDWRLREAVCEQCHLEGVERVVRRGRRPDDYRPGLPLEDFVSVFVYPREPGEDQKAVNHVQQMHLSQCFQRSPEDHKLGCISCHDPHVQVEGDERVAHYRQRCLQCHATHGCSEPEAVRRRRSPQDSCIDCHMPRYLGMDIPHTASTDHRIPRRPRPEQPSPRPPPPGDEPPLVSVH
ncbi:MAG: hypothetical protein JO112_12220, partial [Planctomycetes bacterium]|nr:hypothetical protein [Planctomycetota bacterium]